MQNYVLERERDRENERMRERYLAVWAHLYHKTPQFRLRRSLANNGRPLPVSMDQMKSSYDNSLIFLTPLPIDLNLLDRDRNSLYIPR